ncbi:MAG: hypothetical protein IGR80_11770 [Synechococcales cyanobacterium K44_A2020_017]|nr:hypothetical protein [Synechococcales cyanobacterium K32_A2020_035]MBF2095422.1 hypothetical protein [Synechococcales cyanobacterium K44_A2020_017]
MVLDNDNDWGSGPLPLFLLNGPAGGRSLPTPWFKPLLLGKAVTHRLMQQG